MKPNDAINQKSDSSSISLPRIQASQPNILVTVRIRPLSKKEADISQLETVRIINGNSICVINSSDSKPGKPNNQMKEQQFTFDFVFEKNTNQQVVYESSTKFLLKGVIDGFNATVFAYGATGSGKTYTMLGTGEEPGIMPRAVIDLFAMLEHSKNKEFKMKLSYVEIYNENLRDLLGTGENLEMREDQSKGMIIAGLKEMEVTNSSEVFGYLLKGNQKRAVEATNTNETSSRSHAILQIYLENKEKNVNEIVCGKFILVDLAGSERGSTNTGMRQVEGSNINKSLLALGNCINALVENKKNFIPWRDSKLTRILKDSLGGNSRTVMISTISPSLFSIDETISTLQYANRAKNIITTVKRNAVEVDFQTIKYDEVIVSLNSELEALRAQLAVKTHNQHLLRPQENQNKLIKKIDRLSREISQHFQDEIRLRSEKIEAEKLISSLAITVKSKEYQLYKYLSLKKTGNIALLKEKELKGAINKVQDQITIQNGLVIDKETKINELVKKREVFENLIEKHSGNNLGATLKYLYHYYIFEVNNMTNEHIRRQDLNLLRQKDLKISKLIEQLKIRDEYISNEKKELEKKHVRFVYEKESNIRPIAELNIDRSYCHPMIVSQTELPITKLSTPSASQRNYMPIPTETAARSSPNRNNSNLYDYSGYTNPNVIKEKQVIKTKTTQIIKKGKNNELSNLKLNMINDLYKSSKIIYVNKKNMRNGYRDDNVITFDTRRLNQSASHVSSISNVSTSQQSNSLKNIKEREIDYKIKRLLAKKKNNPYVKY